jgi:hypothetical protein
MDLKDFEKKLEETKLQHWSIPNQKLLLEKQKPGTYLLRVLENNFEKFPGNESCSFEIHFEPTERLLGLFVKTSIKGWFLSTLDLWDLDDLKLTIIKLYNDRKELMEEIYEREFRA